MIDKWICVRLRLRVERAITPSYVIGNKLNSIIIIVTIILTPKTRYVTTK